MTTGFGYIYKKMFQSRRDGTTMLKIDVDRNTYGMLKELAREEGTSIEKLAAELFKKEVIKWYEKTDEHELIWQSLSERQKEVAALACLDYTNVEIAEKMSVSIDTVKKHMTEALRKFGIRGRHQLGYILKKWDFSAYDKN